MNFKPLSLPGSYMIELTPRGDARGRFTRLFCEKEISQIEWTKHIVNVNASVTQLKGTIRGMHFQKPPKAEVKIVRCVRGAVYDVIVDIRKDSPTFLQHIGVELTDSNDRMLYIPEGFAHGFQTLTDDVEFMYFVTEFYSSEQEGGLRYNDPRLAISWKLEPTEISLRDRNHPLLDNDFTGLNISVLSTIPDNYHFAI